MTKARSEPEKEVTFSKKQLMKSKKYEEQKDILKVLLKERDLYTIGNVNEIIKKFMEEVK